MTKSLEQLNQEFEVLRAQAENILKEDNYRIIAPSSEDDNSKFGLGVDLLFKNPEDAVAVAKYLELAWLLGRDQNPEGLIPAGYDKDGDVDHSSNPFVDINVLKVGEGEVPPVMLRLFSDILPKEFEHFVYDRFANPYYVDAEGDAGELINRRVKVFKRMNPEATNLDRVKYYSDLYAKYARPLVLGVTDDEVEAIDFETDELKYLNGLDRDGLFKKFSAFIVEKFGADPFGYEYYKEYLYEVLPRVNNLVLDHRLNDDEEKYYDAIDFVRYMECDFPDDMMKIFANEILYRNHPLFKDVFVARQAKGYEDAIDALFADNPKIARKIRASFEKGNYHALKEKKWNEFDIDNGLISEALPENLSVIGIPTTHIAKGA